MSYRAWHYRRTPDGQFVGIATAAMQRLFDGQIGMEPTVPGAVHIATLYVQVANRRATGLEHVRFDRYPVNERGECTPEIMTEMRRMWAFVASDWYSRGTARVAGRHMQDYVKEYAYWTPTTAEKRALAVAVNRRAGRPLYQPEGRPLFPVTS